MKSFSISSIIGYLIGGVFVLLILFAPIGVTSYFVYNFANALLNYESDTAQIIRCESKRLSGSSARYKRVPVAITDSGNTIKGSMDEVRWVYKCNDLIGKKVKVLVDPNNKNKGHINSFWQLWFMPILFLIISLIYYPFIIKAYIKKLTKHKRN